MIQLILGIVIIVLGLFSIIKGKLPFIKRYTEVKNIKLHSRIEGIALLLIGILLIFHYFVPTDTIALMLVVLSIGIFSLILEIALKAI